MFCSVENDEVVELCPDGREMFNAYLRARHREEEKRV